MAKFQLLVPEYLGPSVAVPTLNFLKSKFGANCLRLEQAFSDKVNWTPTIQLKTSATELLLVEVAESLYPAVFSIAYAQIINEEAMRPIKVYQACPLTSFQADKKHEQVRRLKSHGFGLITVDEQGTVDIQFPASVLIHHVSDKKFEETVKGMPMDTKSALVKAFEVYRTDANQGLQHAGQVVEALIHLIASQCHARGLMASYKETDKASAVIDKLYASATPSLADQRASFGGARSFMKLGRNASSHPSKTVKQAQEKAVLLREGFESAIRVCGQLCVVRKSLRLNRRLSL